MQNSNDKDKTVNNIMKETKTMNIEWKAKMKENGKKKLMEMRVMFTPLDGW